METFTFFTFASCSRRTIFSIPPEIYPVCISIVFYHAFSYILVAFRRCETLFFTFYVIDFVLFALFVPQKRCKNVQLYVICTEIWLHSMFLYHVTILFRNRCDRFRKNKQHTISCTLQKAIFCLRLRPFLCKRFISLNRFRTFVFRFPERYFYHK